jgi:hypothetical protein
MFMKREWVWATAITIAALSPACNTTDSAGLSPTAPSASSPTDLSAEQTAELTEACAFGSGTVVLVPGPTPPVGAPGTPVTPPTSGTSPGVAPSGPPAPGTQMALGGTIESQTGSCPAITLTIGGKAVRTTATTSFGSGSCSALKQGDQVGALGTAQADGTLAASCVAGF